MHYPRGAVLARRLLIFAALLLGLGVLAASVAPRDTRTAAEPSGAAAPTAPSSAGVPDEPELSGREDAAGGDDVPGEPPLRRLDAGASRQELRARVGERVRLAIFSDELATVQVGDDGPIEPIDPDAPARFSLLYDDAVELPIRVLESGRTIGVLRIVEAGG